MYKDLVAYILLNYPYKDDLTNGRVNKILYLSDWKACLLYDRQLSEIKWVFNHYGPYVTELIEGIKNDKRFILIDKTTYFGNPKLVLSLQENASFKAINKEAKEVLDFVIKVSKDYNWSDFIKLVYSTYPVANSCKGSILDLVSLAREYKKQS